MTRLLSCPAPRRVWTLQNGLWASHPWTKVERLAYIEAGGWFAPNAHDFAEEREASQ